MKIQKNFEIDQEISFRRTRFVGFDCSVANFLLKILFKIQFREMALRIPGNWKNRSVNVIDYIQMLITQIGKCPARNEIYANILPTRWFPVSKTFNTFLKL